MWMKYMFKVEHCFNSVVNTALLLFEFYCLCKFFGFDENLRNFA